MKLGLQGLVSLVSVVIACLLSDLLFRLDLVEVAMCPVLVEGLADLVVAKVTGEVGSVPLLTITETSGSL